MMQLAENETTRDFKSFLLLHLEWDRYSFGKLPHTCLVKSESVFCRKDIRFAPVGGFLWKSSLDFNLELMGFYSTVQNEWSLFKCPLRLLFLYLLSWWSFCLHLEWWCAGQGWVRTGISFPFGSCAPQSLTTFVAYQEQEGKCLTGKGINMGWEHSPCRGIRTIVADKESSAEFAAGKEVIREGGKINY